MIWDVFCIFSIVYNLDQYNSSIQSKNYMYWRADSSLVILPQKGHDPIIRAKD